MEKNEEFFCEHCGTKAEHELLFPVRGDGTIRYISVCGVCLTRSAYEVRATNEEIRSVKHVYYLCSCGIHVRGKIISEREMPMNNYGKNKKYTEIIVECPRPHCRKKRELII